jgi:hypothetical protein
MYKLTLLFVLFCMGSKLVLFLQNSRKFKSRDVQLKLTEDSGHFLEIVFVVYTTGCPNDEMRISAVLSTRVGSLLLPEDGLFIRPKHVATLFYT